MKNVRPIYGQDYAPGFSLFVKNNSNIFSKGIIWFQSLQEISDFTASHVLFVIDEQLGLEASEEGIDFCELENYFHDESCQVVCREPVGINEIAFLQAWNYGLSIKGRPYDYTGLALGFPLMILSGLSKWVKFLRKLPVPFHIPGARVCSSFVADCYKHTDKYFEVKLLKEWHVSRISPVMLWNDFPYKQFRFDKKR